MRMKLGTELHPEDRAYVLAAFVHRFTRDHRPRWAMEPMPNGRPYALQFDSDEDWLAHTRFAVRADGRLDRRARYCKSSPTWPDNPELRTEAG